jgi:hypothetical protein
MFSTAKLAKLLQTQLLQKLQHAVWDTRSDLQKQVDAKWSELETIAPDIQEDEMSINKLKPDELNKALKVLSEIDQLIAIHPSEFPERQQNNLKKIRELFIYFCQATDAYKKLDGNELRYMLSVQAAKLGGGNDSFGLAAINLLVHLEKQQNPDFNCQVVDIKNFSDSLKEILDCSELAAGESKRVQLIVHNRGHYSTVDFKISANNHQCIVLDAANDPRMSEIIVHLNKSKAFYPPPLNQQFAITGNKKFNIQSDYSSCPVFALDHAVQISKMDLYDNLAVIMNKEKAIDWLDLPQELIWNAQSKSWVDFYKTQHPNEDLSLLEFRINASHIKTYENPFKTDPTTQTGRKLSRCLDTTDRLFSTYAKKINDYLTSTRDNGLEEVFKNIPQQYINPRVPTAKNDTETSHRAAWQ